MAKVAGAGPPKGAGARLRAGYCLTSLSEAHRKSRESAVSARQMAKVAGAGPPRAPGTLRAF